MGLAEFDIAFHDLRRLQHREQRIAIEFDLLALVRLRRILTASGCRLNSSCIFKAGVRPARTARPRRSPPRPSRHRRSVRGSCFAPLALPGKRRRVETIEAGISCLLDPWPHHRRAWPTAASCFGESAFANARRSAGISSAPLLLGKERQASRSQGRRACGRRPYQPDQKRFRGRAHHAAGASPPAAATDKASSNSQMFWLPWPSHMAIAAQPQG